MTEKEKNKNREEHKRERKDPLATVDIGDEASAVETVFPRKETSLLGQLAKAITKQEERSITSRQSSQRARKMLALADTPTNTLLSHSLKPSGGEKMCYLMLKR